MTPAATPEALEQALATTIHPSIYPGGNTEMARTNQSPGWLVAVSLAEQIVAEHVAPVLADLQRVTAEKDAEKARADRIDAKLGELNAAVREHLPPIDTLIAEREAAEAALATATAEAASLRAEVAGLREALTVAASRMEVASMDWGIAAALNSDKLMYGDDMGEWAKHARTALARAAAAGEGRSDG